MSTLLIRDWSDISTQEIWEEAIREKFPPPDYRVSRTLYRPNDTNPAGSARQGVLFVVRGKCQCEFGESEAEPVLLAQGQYVTFPEGHHKIEPLNSEDAEVVRVWNLLDLMKKRDSRKIETSGEVGEGLQRHC